MNEMIFVGVVCDVCGQRIKDEGAYWSVRGFEGDLPLTESLAVCASCGLRLFGSVFTLPIVPDRPEVDHALDQ